MRLKKGLVDENASSVIGIQYKVLGDYIKKETKNDIIMPKVAVMVINLNGMHHLENCLNSLRYQTYPNYEVYIVDNGSTDGSLTFIKKYYPWVKIIAFMKNLGFAKGYNEAVKKINGFDFVVFLNNDTKADEKWLSELVKEMVKDDRVAAVGSKILLYYSPTLLHNAGTKISPVTGGFDIALFEKDGAQFSIRTYIGAACGASMLVRKDVFLKVGGFDETYFAFFEDVDFCWRAWLCGYKIVYAPASIVYHERGGSFGQKSALSTFLGGRNQLITIIKNCQWLTLLAGIYFITPILMARVVLSLKEKRLGEVFATFNSVLYVLRNLREIFYKRRIIQRNRVISDRKLLSMGVMATISETIRAELGLLPSKVVEI